MKPALVATAAFALLSCSGFADARAGDEMCMHLAHFAGAVPPGEKQTVLLHGGWSVPPRPLMRHECIHSGSAPGKEFCSYLLPHSSWENGVHNARRAARCLAPAARDDMLRQLAEEKKVAEVTAVLAQDAAASPEITLRFAPGALGEGTDLTISIN